MVRRLRRVEPANRRPAQRRRGGGRGGAEGAAAAAERRLLPAGGSAGGSAERPAGGAVLPQHHAGGTVQRRVAQCVWWSLARTLLATPCDGEAKPAPPVASMMTHSNLKFKPKKNPPL